MFESMDIIWKSSKRNRERGRDFTWVFLSQSSTTTKIASNIRVAILLIIAIKCIRRMGQEGIRFITTPSLLNRSTISFPHSTSPIQSILQINLWNSRLRHTPRSPIYERRVPFHRRRHHRHPRLRCHCSP